MAAKGSFTQAKFIAIPWVGELSTIARTISLVLAAGITALALPP
jgi:hypothetical protein